MKKFFRLLPLLLVAVAGSFVFMSCSDDDKDEVVTSASLPSAAKSFLQQYFPEATVVTATKDKDEYEVVLSDGTRVDFTLAGDWTDVDAAPGRVIPSGFYPSAIDSYVAANYAGTGINEISREVNGYDVELVTGLDLIFGTDGSFIGIDR